RAVRRSQELVGAPPLGAAQRLAQRSVRQYDRLREVELVVRLQRLAQRGAAHRLRPSGCRRQDERHEPQSPPRPPRPRHGCSWMSVSRLITVLLASNCTASFYVLYKGLAPHFVYILG